MSPGIPGMVSADEQATLYEAAKAGAKTSREYNAKMENTGVDILRNQGLDVVDQIDRAKFRAAFYPRSPSSRRSMAPA